jgi:MFS family permease
MNWAKNFIDSSWKNRRIILGLVYLFVIINWILLCLTEQIGPPDFYKLHDVAQKLFSGDLKIGIVPPLFPLLMYPLGKLAGLFAEPADAFILASRFIALLASLGVAGFTYLFLEKFTGKFSVIGMVIMVVSPWYLKLLSFPITDMLYLLLVAATFYGFAASRSPLFTASTSIAAIFTRFEGVLLILSWAINNFKRTKKNLLMMLALIPVSGGLLLFFYYFAPRIFAHLTDIVLARKSYLFVFQHPMDFLNVIYGNILFFIPYKFPYALKLAALIAIMCLFGFGLYHLFRLNKKLTLALFSYQVLFFIAKGYIDVTAPEREFRRIFSGLWIFYIVAFIGCWFFLKKIKPHRIPWTAVLIFGGLFFAVMALYQEIPQSPFQLLALLVVPGLIIPLLSLKTKSTTKIVVIMVLALFTLQVYRTSYRKSVTYVESYARKAAYASAQWLNNARLKNNAVILYYTDNSIIEYYLDKKRAQTKNIQRIHFTVPMRNTPEEKDRYIELFFNEMKEKQVDYIIFDNYVVQKPEFLGINDVQKLLYEEKENRQLFRLKKNLFYKGKNVGYVLKPIYDKTNN